MPGTAVVFRTTQRIKFAELDPYNHLHTAHYASCFIDHRMEGLRDRIGWDQRAIAQLPFFALVRRLEIDFLKPVLGDQEIVITSSVREFRGADAHIECTMSDTAGKALSRCAMIVACVSKQTNRPMDWPDDAKARFFED